MKGTIEIKVPKYLPLDFNMRKNAPIREKKEIIDLIIISSEIILEKLEYEDSTYYNELVSDDKIIFVNKKMRRLFYKCDNKIFSIAYPFFIKNKGLFSFFDKNKISKEILNIMKYINSIYSNLETPLDIYENDEVYSEETITEGWKIYSKILLSETGYIRYDYDEEHENGRLHPLNHLDVFYESSSTFKIGLNRKINMEDFIDLLEVETNCKYLE